MIQAVRGLLRHLHRTGRVVEDCSRFIQGPRRYRLASIPTTISMDEVRRLLATTDRRSAIGRRNYAIVLLLAVYGLRARLHIRAGKFRKARLVPMRGSLLTCLETYLERRQQAGAPTAT